MLYFDVQSLGNGEYSKTFLFASDSVSLSRINVSKKAHSHYIVKIFKDQDGSFNHYEVFDFLGNDVTQQFITTVKNPPKRYLIFSNGYRGPTNNWLESDGLVTNNDRYNYWGSIDGSFINKLHPQTKNTYYIDGSFRIWTSNHLNMANFADSWTRLEDDGYYALNTTPNVDGFNYRKYQGRLAGRAFLAKIKSDPRSNGVKDTIDIVAHSMGYAYAVGLIEEIKNQVHFGRFYIIAPENACSGGSDWSLFEEVWQYGSNNNVNDPERDPYGKQDGIAPQCEVLGINGISSTIPHGRAYIPTDVAMPDATLGNFLGCHSITNYDWIFTNLTPTQIGYVKER